METLVVAVGTVRATVLLGGWDAYRCKNGTLLEARPETAMDQVVMEVSYLGLAQVGVDP